jgi:hypothetical protein
VLVGVLFATKPAPLEVAGVACHVVAPRYFLNTGLTFGTVSNVPIVCSPPIEILIDYSIAFGSPMPRLTALKAHFVTTFTCNPIA